MPIIVCLISWHGNDSLSLSATRYFFSAALFLPLAIPLMIYGICGVVINWKKMKIRKLWYSFTKTNAKNLDGVWEDECSYI
ncbi:MAG: hypothetical protein LBJ97_00815 [Mycoplasmataceae bacterium]|nr:hypothetical protein [Mycoplasmataceae bacterium]